MKNKINAIAQTYLEYNGKSFRHPQGLAVSITEDEGQFMYDFIKEHDLTTGFEIGTGTGYSGLWFLAALPCKGRFCTIDSHTEDRYRSKCQQDCVTMLEEFRESGYLMLEAVSPGDIKEAIKGFSVICKDANNMDFVFIDGDHNSYSIAKDFAGIHPFMAHRAAIFWHDSACAKEAMEIAKENGFSEPVECQIGNTYGLAYQTRGFN